MKIRLTRPRVPSALSPKEWAAIFIAFVAIGLPCAARSAELAPCRAESTVFDGWQAEQLSNSWVTLTIVPELGGRLMQVSFGRHAFLFVNPEYRGKIVPPQNDASPRRWINYGGDKVWPMPEGTKDEQHWPGPLSGPLDDGGYAPRVLSRQPDCAVELTGPPDPLTGLQYSRDIRIGSGSPEVFFHAVMKNVTGHPLRWSMQSVTQYDTADASHPGDYNHDFHAFTPANPQSAYLDGYHVAYGPAHDPSFSISNGLFSLHWLYLGSEVWVDSPGDWVAVVDGSSQYAMIERFHRQTAASYPGKATVIFYTNGPAIRLASQGAPEMTPADPVGTPYYMEAELNSPLVDLAPGGAYAMDTEWFPTRLEGPLSAVTYAGAVSQPLQATSAGSQVHLSGSFGVFFPGELVAVFYGAGGARAGTIRLASASPLRAVNLQQTVTPPVGAVRVSLHLQNASGLDLGSLGEAWINAPSEGKNR
ncbi:MAG: hypothetical protein ACRD1N_04035 [Terriglobia bacterium]